MTKAALCVAGLLCVPCVLSAGEPAKDTPRGPHAEGADKKYLSAADLYAEPNSAVGIRKFMGRLVKLDVVVKIERTVPLVEIVPPAGRAPNSLLSAHLVTVTTQAAEMKKGEQALIKGVIVDE